MVIPERCIRGQYFFPRRVLDTHVAGQMSMRKPSITNIQNITNGTTNHENNQISQPYRDVGKTMCSTTPHLTLWSTDDS
jgi:hypothetical protein